MKDRIKKIMEGQQMTQQTFAEYIGMSPASLSSIFNGRTRPTLNIVEAIKSKFPNISTDWLMFGTGSMYDTHESQGGVAHEAAPTSPVDGVLDFSAQSEPTVQDLFAGVPEQNMPKTAKNQTKIIPNFINKKQREITEIRIFFDDQTWETFVPKA